MKKNKLFKKLKSLGRSKFFYSCLILLFFLLFSFFLFLAHFYKENGFGYWLLSMLSLMPTCFCFLKVKKAYSQITKIKTDAIKKTDILLYLDYSQSLRYCSACLKKYEKI